MASDDESPRQTESQGRSHLIRAVRLTEDAARDLDGVRAWFTQPGAGAQAARRLGHILVSIDRLADHPCLYPRVGHHRELSVEGHRVIYRVTPDTDRDATAGDVLVLRIWGPGQNRDSHE